jgi:hypothetical protein
MDSNVASLWVRTGQSAYLESWVLWEGTSHITGTYGLEPESWVFIRLFLWARTMSWRTKDKVWPQRYACVCVATLDLCFISAWGFPAMHLSRLPDSNCCRQAERSTSRDPHLPLRLSLQATQQYVFSHLFNTNARALICTRMDKHTHTLLHTNTHNTHRQCSSALKVDAAIFGWFP